MHILVIPSWYPHSYKPLIGIFFKEQAEMLAKNNNKVGVIAIQPISIVVINEYKKLSFNYEKYLENNVQTYKIQYPEIPKLHHLKEFIKLNIFKRIFQTYMKEHGLPDIIHLHSFINGELAIWLDKEYGIPYVVTEHSSAFGRNFITKKSMQLAKKVFHHSKYNIVVSKKLGTLLTEIMAGEKFIYVPNSVDTSFFNCEQGKPKENFNFNFINIAFYTKNKNQAMLIQAFAKSFKGQETVRLTLVGGGPEYHNLKKLIQELHITTQVILKKEASRDEVKKLLQNSDVFVLSSSYETFGVVIIEAMACGLPVVATKCGGPESILRDTKVGVLSNIDEESLSRSLIYTYTHIENFDSKYIHKYAEDNFSEEAVYLTLENIYKDIIYHRAGLIK